MEMKALRLSPNLTNTVLSDEDTKDYVERDPIGTEFKTCLSLDPSPCSRSL